uniref:Uncharacterized protein n=1 Tax=Rhizophora mucronata TaxID=61149 RepID=A0A2P2Q5W5_RHIMU
MIQETALPNRLKLKFVISQKRKTVHVRTLPNELPNISHSNGNLFPCESQ